MKVARHPARSANTLKLFGNHIYAICVVLAQKMNEMGCMIGDWRKPYSSMGAEPAGAA